MAFLICLFWTENIFKTQTTASYKGNDQQRQKHIYAIIFTLNLRIHFAFLAFLSPEVAFDFPLHKERN